MLELLIGAVSLCGVIAIALERPPAPRAIPVWTDERERRRIESLRYRDRW